MSANPFAVNLQAGLPPARAVLAELWAAAGPDSHALTRFSATGSEPALRSSFAVGTALQAALGAATLAATEMGRVRGAPAAHASVELLDFGAGYLLAFGALAALMHQRQQGGNWRVQVSLAGVGHWLQHLGRIADPDGASNLDFEAVSEDIDSGFGRLRTVRHAAHIGGRKLN